MTETPDRPDYIAEDGFVDVRKLIAAYTFEEHAERADQYFRNIGDPTHHLLRKPFSIFGETQIHLPGLAALFHMLRLNAGDTVVDFGCGTGWLSVAMAQLRCRPIGLDVAPRALEIARAAVAEHPILRPTTIPFLQIQGGRLPLEDASVDRIICMDSFHHVVSQEDTLAEFFRVLRPGGMAGFHEPGPQHSRGESSQYDMREYAVIENDIVIEDIAATAQRLGFEPPMLAIFNETPIVVGAEEYNGFLHALDNPDGLAALVAVGRHVMQQVVHKRVFALRKPGEAEPDSRLGTALRGAVTIEEARLDQGVLALRLRVRNLGSGRWIASDWGVGAVSLGLRVFDAAGGELTAEPIRAPLSSRDVPPGGEVVCEVTVDARDYAGAAAVEADLVSEWVTWFGPVGHLEGGAPRAALG